MGKKNKVAPYTPGNFKALGLCTPYDKKGGTCIISALGAARRATAVMAGAQHALSLTLCLAWLLACRSGVCSSAR